MDARRRPEVKIQSVGIAFQIIHFLKENGPTSVQSIADEFNISVSSAHRYLTTICNFDYVTKTEEGKYKLGLAFFDKGQYIRCNMDIFNTSEKKIGQIAEMTGEIVQLMVEESGVGFRLALEYGEDSVSTNTRTGQWVYLHTTAAGKAILAELPESRVENILSKHGLPKFSENTITDEKQLIEELTKIKQNGYAYNDSERIEGLMGIGVPIMRGNTVAGALSLAGPANRFNSSRYKQEIPEILSGAANEIELKLQYES